MPPKKKVKFVSQRERAEILQDFMDNLENEDDYDIFERSDNESEDGDEDSY